MPTSPLLGHPNHFINPTALCGVVARQQLPASFFFLSSFLIELLLLIQVCRGSPIIGSFDTLSAGSTSRRPRPPDGPIAYLPNFSRTPSATPAQAVSRPCLFHRPERPEQYFLIALVQRCFSFVLHHALVHRCPLLECGAYPGIPPSYFWFLIPPARSLPSPVYSFSAGSPRFPVLTSPPMSFPLPTLRTTFIPPHFSFFPSFFPPSLPYTTTGPRKSILSCFFKKKLHQCFA